MLSSSILVLHLHSTILHCRAEEEFVTCRHKGIPLRSTHAICPRSSVGGRKFGLMR